MRIFDKVEGWEEKVNFVDENNVLVGYDMAQQCCEDAGWWISKTELGEGIEKLTDKFLETWVFDTDYFECAPYLQPFNEGSIAMFRLVNNENEELFLHLSNCHNGYYSHGFTAEVNGITWREGFL